MSFHYCLGSLVEVKSQWEYSSTTSVGCLRTVTAWPRISLSSSFNFVLLTCSELLFPSFLCDWRGNKQENKNKLLPSITYSWAHIWLWRTEEARINPWEIFCPSLSSRSYFIHWFSCKKEEEAAICKSSVSLPVGLEPSAYLRPWLHKL